MSFTLNLFVLVSVLFFGCKASSPITKDICTGTYNGVWVPAMTSCVYATEPDTQNLTLAEVLGEMSKFIS